MESLTGAVAKAFEAAATAVEEVLVPEEAYVQEVRFVSSRIAQLVYWGGASFWWKVNPWSAWVML